MLDRTTAPPFVQARNFFLPNVKPVVLPNGLALFLVRGVQQEVIKIEFHFPAGRWYEPAPGIAHFTTQMLEKGTKSKNALELAEAFEGLGAHIDIAAGPDSAEVGLYALTKNWRDAFALLIDMILSPAFDVEELDIMKSIYLENLKVNQAKNSFVASQLIRKNMYGSHPYGIAVEESNVTQIDVSHLVQYHRERLRPKAVFVTAPESLDTAELVKALGKLQKAPEGEGSAAVATAGNISDHVDKEGSVQTSLRLGKRMVTKSHPDFPHMLLLNHILGGYFGSRLMRNIREEKGLTYGIHSGLNSLQRDGFFMIGTDVNKENRNLAIDEILSEVSRLATEPVDEEEMNIAANHFLGSLQLEVANPFSVTEKVKNIYVNNLPEDYYQRIFDKVRSATPADLIAIAQRHFAVDDLLRVSVG